MNATRVFTLAAADAARLEDRLRSELPAAEWRRVDHARFALRADGVSLVCYSSGKVVVQGAAIDGFCARYLGEADASAPAATRPGLAFDEPTIGSDEAGKGDYFGPLVVAAVHAAPTVAAELAAMGVADSKQLADTRMFPMAEWIERHLRCAVRALVPADYNQRWAAVRNVNLVLADLHAEAIAELAATAPDAAIVVDRFADPQLITQRLARLQVQPRQFAMVPGAEAHPVVAAASIVARVHFLEGLRHCGEELGVDLPKGAGQPVDAAAARLVRSGARDQLGRVAKLHFRNTDRLPGAP